MAGRAIAVWLRLSVPSAARQLVPAILDVPDDPVVRLRFWDLAHDAGRGREATLTNPEMTGFKEVALAFPASFRGLHGDFTKYIYADDPTYTAFGREVMGWPVRHGKIMIGKPWPGAPLAAGQQFVGYLERNGSRLVSTAVTLRSPIPQSNYPTGLPVWFSAKSIPNVSGLIPVVSQLVRSGPSAMQQGEIWEATASVAIASSPTDDLKLFESFEVVAAQYWTDLDLTISDGEVLAEIPPKTA